MYKTITVIPAKAGNVIRIRPMWSRPYCCCAFANRHVPFSRNAHTFPWIGYPSRSFYRYERRPCACRSPDYALRKIINELPQHPLRLCPLTHTNTHTLFLVLSLFLLSLFISFHSWKLCHSREHGPQGNYVADETSLTWNATQLEIRDEMSKLDVRISIARNSQ